MNTAFQDTLLQLFQQVSDDPDRMPGIPVDGWQEGSREWQLLRGFQDMLGRIQQRMQGALRSEEVQYRSIFEAAIDALFIANMEGFIVEANPAACRIYGYTYEEFIGLHGTAITAPDSRHLIAEALQAIQAGDKFQMPVRAAGLRKDGSTFMTDGYSTPFMYKGTLHILAVIRDVTEQMQAAEQLREKEAQYRSIFEASTDALAISDLVGQEVGRVVEVNPAACKMYGYSYEEFIGLPLSAIVPPERLSFVIEKALPEIRAGREYHLRGVFNLRKDGSRFPIDLHETAFNYQGKLHMLSVVRDITEQVRAERELREKESQYRGIFEASADGLLISDLEGEHIVEANPAICEMNGYTREELLVLPPANLITKSEPESPVHSWQG